MAAIATSVRKEAIDGGNGGDRGGGTRGLPEAASTRGGRERLARSLAGLVLEYGFGGIDLAWVHVSS